MNVRENLLEFAGYFCPRNPGNYAGNIVELDL